MSRVVIVGGGVSGLTAAYRLRQQGLDVTVIERDSEAGGQARSSKHDGFVLDWGPGGFLANAPMTLELAAELGLGAQLRPAADAAKTRFLFSGGRIRALPDNPRSFVTSDLLTPLDKLRALLELTVPPAPAGKDESVYQFASRRFGPGLARAFILPMVLGITSGD
ncbi:MAG TPA: protoporphyrinogen oxidase, partial [Deinococcales bacterium]|nr:protoporphyrinogen oxidase [Deinococcales bacterium]